MSHPNPLAACAARSLAIVIAAMSLAGCQSGQDKDKDKDWFEGGPMQLASPDTMQLTARVLAAKGKTEQAGYLIERMYQKLMGEYGREPTHSELARNLDLEHGELLKEMEGAKAKAMEEKNDSLRAGSTTQCSAVEELLKTSAASCNEVQEQLAMLERIMLDMLLRDRENYAL